MKHHTEMENHFDGSPVLVIGNGGSLKDVPTELFDKYPTFGMNSCYANDYLNENPVDVYCIEGLGHLKNEAERSARMPYIEKVAEAGGFSLVNRRMAHHFQHLPNVYYIDYVNPAGQHHKSFEFQPFDYYGSGHCVTFCVLQFAYYLTTGEVLMVGLDHKFDGDKWHGYDEAKSPEFSPMPQAEYQKFRTRVDPKFNEVAEVYRLTNRTLLNLTPASDAKMFESDDMENWL